MNFDDDDDDDDDGEEAGAPGWERAGSSRGVSPPAMAAVATQRPRSGGGGDMAELEKFNDELSALADLDLDFGSIDGVASDGAAADSVSSSSSSSSTAAGDDRRRRRRLRRGARAMPARRGRRVAAATADGTTLMGDNALEDFGDFPITAAGEES